MNFLLNNVLNKINSRLERLGIPLAELKMSPEQETDAIISCFGQDRAVELKKNLTAGHFARLEKQLSRHNAILFTEYIPPALAECLQRSNIEYADIAGNIFLKNGGNCILIENCAKPRNMEVDIARGRAMTPAGLKVLFLLLTEPEAINWNYRKLSDYAGVSLGSVKYVMADLQERKWLIELQGQWCFQGVQNIYERWTNAYIEKIFCKYETMRFRGELDLNDEQLTEKYPIVFTGEAAAARMHLMEPARLCLYQWGNINELIVRNRWTPDANGNIEIRRAFWPVLREFKSTVPSLLIYADLIAENDGRCLDVAKTIYEKDLNNQELR